MTVKYLGRQRALTTLPKHPAAQLVNVPELQATQRCHRCVYYSSERTRRDYQRCMTANKCGEESLLFAKLVNAMGDEHKPVSTHFSPTPLVTQAKINNEKRYLQLWSCDLDNYVCCSLCHYYPARIAASQSVADCSNSHNCGRNGSWFDLLELSDSDLYDLPDIFSSSLPDGQYYLLDGTILNATPVTVNFNATHMLYAYMSDGNEYLILNMLPNAANAGFFGYAYQSLFPYLFWDMSYINTTVDPSSVLLLTRSGDDLVSALRSAGASSANIYDDPGEVVEVITSDLTRTYLQQNYYECYARSVGDLYVMQITDYTNSHYFVFRLGDTNYYIGQRDGRNELTNLIRVKLDSVPTSLGTVITLTSYNDDITQWLIACGCPKTLFTSL